MSVICVFVLYFKLTLTMSIPSEEPSQDPVPEWKQSYATFTAHMDSIAQGWAERQVIAHAGKPTTREKNVWYYNFRQGGFGCVRYCYYKLTIRNGRVSEIDSGGGHMLIESVHGMN